LYPRHEKVSADDNEAALRALAEFNEHQIPDISDDELARSNILLAKASNKEGYNLVNTNLWPYSYYTYPYYSHVKGAWPPGMYSRMYHWSPGFYTSGWSYYLRPGLSQKGAWPENRWVRNNNSYYFINNRSDYDTGAKNYS